MTHLSEADLRAWDRDGSGRERVLMHLAGCDECCTRYAEFLRHRPVESAPEYLRSGDFVAAGYAAVASGPSTVASRRVLATVVALAAALVVGVLVFRTPSSTAPATIVDRPSRVRGAAMQPISPAGAAEAPLVFRWSGADGVRVRIDVLDDQHAIFTMTADGIDGRVDAPPALLRLLVAGHRYQWRLSTLDAAGDEQSRSDLVGFELSR